MHVTSAFPKLVLGIVTFVGIIGLAPTIGNAQTARIEVHPFHTVTLTNQQFLTGAKDGKPVVIAGALRLPRPGPSARRGPCPRLRWGGRQCGSLVPGAE
jgi:hypothetical protein